MTKTHFARFIGLLLTMILYDPASAKTEGTVRASNFTFESIDGGTLALADYAGKAMLIVNTATQCGFTRQYAGLQDLWTRYRERGFVVIGVPSNDFGGQEPRAEWEIKQFCELNYGIDFPMTAKSAVKGGDAHPFYRWAAGELGSLAKPRWNFHKYLIAPDGRLVAWFSTATPPTARKVIEAVEANLPE